MPGTPVHTRRSIRESEDRVIGCDDKVARCRDGKTVPMCGAADCADDRNCAVLDREERLAHLEHAFAHVDLSIAAKSSRSFPAQKCFPDP